MKKATASGSHTGSAIIANISKFVKFLDSHCDREGTERGRLARSWRYLLELSSTCQWARTRGRYSRKLEDLGWYSGEGCSFLWLLTETRRPG